MYIRGLGWNMDWIDLAQNKDRRPAFFESGNEPSGSIKFGEFVKYLSCLRLRKASAPWSK